MKEKKLSLSELKKKAGKAFLDANAVKGGLLAACHTPDPETNRTDAV